MPACTYVIAFFMMICGTAGAVFAAEPPCSQASLVLFDKTPPPAVPKLDYAYLNGGGFIAPAIPESPDPLIRYRWMETHANDKLQVYYLRPVAVRTDTPDAFEGLESLTSETPKLVVKAPGSIRMDFGVESAAWLQFDSPDLGNSKVTLSISEYNQPAIFNAGSQSPIKTTAPVKYGQTYRLELNKELYEGVRFGWLHVHEVEKPFTINNIRAVCQIKPTNYTGSFNCSDPMLTRMWYVGAYGVKLNLLEDYFGAILIERSDRHSWTGDAHTSQAASLVAFSNYDFIKHNIDRTSADNNSIESYSLYWIFSVLDYYWYAGDEKAFLEYIPSIETKLSHALDIYGTNPKLGFFGHDERLGAAFEFSECPENQRAYKMLVIRACREFAQAAGLAGKGELRDKYRQAADQLIEQLRRDENWYAEFGIHACADAVNAGFTNSTEQAAMYVKEFADPVQCISYSPFNQYFLIQALARMGRYDKALASSRRCWGGQIELGATTFWEVYRPEWQNFRGPLDMPPNATCGYVSYCHPWGGGITMWLSQEILGIKPTTPGFATYSIVPHLPSSLTWVEGKTHTPRGDIAARFDLETGNCYVEAPADTIGRIGIPIAGLTVNRVEFDGRVVLDKGEPTTIEGLKQVHKNGQFVYLEGVQPGRHEIKVAYEGQRQPWTEEATQYAATVVGTDTQTAGNWGGTYGADGFMLFNYNGDGQHQQSLPEYVESITWKQDGIGMPRNVTWTSETDDPRAPATDATNDQPRKIGALSTQNPAACFQTFVVDVALKQEHPCQVALYLVDWDRADRQAVVNMFDLKTNNLIAPTQMIPDYAGGVYLIYQYNKSARFRMQSFPGPDVLLTGIFFDPAQ